MTTKPKHETEDAFLRGIDSKFKKMEDAFHAMGAFMQDYTSLYDSFVSYRKALRETLQEWNEASAHVTTLEAENAELKARLSAMTADRNSWHGQCSDLAALLSELDAQRVPLTDAWQDVSACPDGDVWFSLSCGHVVMGYKHGNIFDWEANIDHDCCCDATATKAMPVTPPAAHGINGLEVKT